MGLLLLEIMAAYHAPLHEIVADLQANYGPVCYARLDVQSSEPKPKKQIVRMLADTAPNRLNGESVVRVDMLDGIKFYLSDQSWLLIRPSGTEPILRIYAEAHSTEAVKSLLEHGDCMGKRVTAN
jgi:phosphomannomutase